MASPGAYRVLIDPGHGGFDGGTTAHGVVEKDINLAISLPLRDIFRLFGFSVGMTRESDRALDDAGDSVRSKKVQDMHNRLGLYEQAETVISVHQNYFQQEKYSGTQVFYGGNQAESRLLAECIRTSVKEGLQPSNDRQCKKATDGIYLLHHTQRVAVLVECGFLSNPEECRRLTECDYQRQMALSIFEGYLEYLDQKEDATWQERLN